ncbi:MAG: ABC transporter ATP-binding protein [Cytophagales bacterium]|jgi:ABC-2 type transport system ATP-binding protein|nr:ABC transporter ATP-binding protein [Cytophagales bacterium]
MILKVDNVSKNYGEIKVLENIFLEIKSGEVVGMLGKNGAGKSTLLKIITGFLWATQGNVFIENKILNKKLQKKIGYLPELNPLYNDMFVLEYLDFFTKVYDIPTPQKKIRYLIELCSLDKVYKKKISTLSKGNKQRVGFARVLLHDPEILILDEPLNGLDPEQILNMLNIIKLFGKDGIILFSTHILQEVISICSRVVVVEKGKLKYDFSSKTCNIESLNSIFST